MQRPISIGPACVALIASLWLTGCEQITCARSGGRTGPGDPSPLRGRMAKGTPGSEVAGAFRKVHELYEKRVVFISTEKGVRTPAPWPFNPFGNQKQTGLGSGFFISSDGFICTNHHVVADVDKVTVRVGSQEYEARVIGSDEQSDIALLKVDGKDFEPAFFGSSDKVRVGDWAIAIGNPFGLDRSFTVGVISALSRQTVDASGNNHIQTDASINPGNSGGPLINIDGEVIGVNRMIYSRTGGSLGIGFAIPIGEARRILDQLRRKGRVTRGYLGVQIADVDQKIAEKLGLPEARGVYVATVLPGGPAHVGGVRAGDVILQVNGKPTEKSGQLMGAVSRAAIGTRVRLALWRKGRSLQRTVVTTPRPR